MQLIQDGPLYKLGSQVLISPKYNISFSEDTRLGVSDLQRVKCPCWRSQRASGINIGSEFRGRSRVSGKGVGSSLCIFYLIVLNIHEKYLTDQIGCAVAQW